jgi:hypothetical protein
MDEISSRYGFRRDKGRKLDSTSFEHDGYFCWNYWVRLGTENKKAFELSVHSSFFDDSGKLTFPMNTMAQSALIRLGSWETDNYDTRARRRRDRPEV